MLGGEGGGVYLQGGTCMYNSTEIRVLSVTIKHSGPCILRPFTVCIDFLPMKQ